MAIPGSNQNYRPLKIAAGLVFALIVLLILIAGWIQKWLWMKQVGYAGIFWEIWTVHWGMFTVACAAAFLYLWINLRIAAGSGAAYLTSAVPPEGFQGAEGEVGPLIPVGTRPAVFAVSAMLAIFYGILYYAQWDALIRLRYGQSFGTVDPVFGKDIGFYVFRLPFYELLQKGLAGLALIALVAVIFTYWIFRMVALGRGGYPVGNQRAVPHLSTLLIVLVGSWGWGFYLDRFRLLNADRGVVHGMGYTDAHVTLTALWIMIVASIVLCLLLLGNFLRPRFRALWLAGGTYAVLYVVSIHIVPDLVQHFSVLPNELAYETPYLKNNIELTRKAFALDRIRETSYPALEDLDAPAIARNEDTIQNVRLWDSRPLLETYRQTQEIRLYYQFHNVNVDRYHLSDGYHQVMLSTRELAPSLPQKAQTWVNRYLQFTHGYGIVMSFVSKSIGDGFPQYLLENIPPESDYGLAVSQPAIYYGDSTPGYRIVSTGVKEFDYPKGNQNVYTSYQGEGGIPIDSWWKRALFSWTQSDINILLTSYLSPESRIQIWRQVGERVSQIAPFLQLDANPYAVLSEGRLYWIQDAYTTSAEYPYSSSHIDEHRNAVNYIRNSVKAVVDMYDGTVRFYAMDPDDPVLAAYSRAFPGTFRNLASLPASLRAHLRYPRDLFSAQADMYRSFHMKDPQVFYNQEDLWAAANQKYSGTAIPMLPYYILMKLPDSNELEYLLMTPFTPPKRDNMIAWLAAECDPDHYGNMLVYQLPKEKLVYGPMQVEAMIDQNTAISEQLSLWDQKGSQVFRGNLIAIPIEKSFLYVEPVYLVAEATNIPQLKRVIVVAGDRVAMEPTLDEAVSAVFHTPAPTAQSPVIAIRQQDIDRARTEFENAQKAMRNGDWESFGKAMEDLKKSLTAPGP